MLRWGVLCYQEVLAMGELPPIPPYYYYQRVQQTIFGSDWC